MLSFSVLCVGFPDNKFLSTLRAREELLFSQLFFSIVSPDAVIELRVVLLGLATFGAFPAGRGG